MYFKIGRAGSAKPPTALHNNNEHGFEIECRAKCERATDNQNHPGYGFNNCYWDNGCTCEAGAAGALTGGRFIQTDSGHCTACHDCNIGDEFE